MSEYKLDQTLGNIMYKSSVSSVIIHDSLLLSMVVNDSADTAESLTISDVTGPIHLPGYVNKEVGIIKKKTVWWVTHPL